MCYRQLIFQSEFKRSVRLIRRLATKAHSDYVLTYEELWKKYKHMKMEAFVDEKFSSRFERLLFDAAEKDNC